MKALFFKRCEGSILMEICFQGGTGFHVVSDNLVCFFHLVSRRMACRPSRSVSRQVVSRVRDCRMAGRLPRATGLRYEPLLQALFQQLSCVRHPQLLHHVGAVRLDRLGADL